MSSLLKPLKWVAKIGRDAAVGTGENQNYIPMILSYYRHNPERKNVSAARHEPGRQHPCVR